jgi:hypothetical protein
MDRCLGTPRRRQRPSVVLMFLAFEGWTLRVGERREVEQGVARMMEELQKREQQEWFQRHPGYCSTCEENGYFQGTCWRCDDDCAGICWLGP